ncbi:hypothetical protein [Pseudoalteromonas viridis]|uniref:Tail specific protease domain-containing protein n=1 Tax=Pseudoalteromonas viridis TaxID=339617 RepID=A0ABX7VEU4_9GAMM|nr:hypothetical protein [Pseudoalteromonas viridis]QTL37850.1 hypothetical protein J5X90_19095 [Pseudoalteromonas viridis]
MRIRNLIVSSLVTSSLGFAAGVYAQASNNPNGALRFESAPVLAPVPGFVLDNELLQDVKQFVKLVHKVKFFYPSQAVKETDWDKFIAESIVALSQVQPHKRQALGLQRLREIAPLLSDSKYTLPELAGDQVVSTWVHSGARMYTVYYRDLLTEPYESLKAYELSPDRDFARIRYGWRTLYLPLFLPEQESKQGISYTDYRQWQIGNDFASLPVCLSVVSGMWGEIHHYWPYFEQNDVNWRRSLRPLLKACSDDTPLARIQAINRQFKKLQDNHIDIVYPKDYGPSLSHVAPFIVDIVEGKPIVVALTDSVSSELSIGDELLALNGVAYKTLLEARSGWLLKSDHVSDFTAADSLNYTFSEQSIKAVFRKQDGSIIELAARTMPISEFEATQKHEVVPNSAEVVESLGDGLWRFNLYNVTKDNAQQVKAQLSEARGVVIDLRQYPKDFMAWHDALSWFITQPVANDTLSIYWRKGPSRRANHQTNYENVIEVAADPIHVPVVALASRSSISQTEHALVYVKKAGIPVLGVPTAGINGNTIAGWYLGTLGEGGLRFSYTGMRADNADGSVLIGRGIQPDMYVPRTIESVIANEDNQLAEAIEYLKEQL